MLKDSANFVLAMKWQNVAPKFSNVEVKLDLPLITLLFIYIYKIYIKCYFLSVLMEYIFYERFNLIFCPSMKLTDSLSILLGDFFLVIHFRIYLMNLYGGFRNSWILLGCESLGC